MGKRKLHTLEQAAHFLGEPVERVRRRVDERELPCVRVDGEIMIPAIPLRDFYYDHLLKVKRKQGTPNSKTLPVASNVPKESKKVPLRENVSKEDQWVSSAFIAGKIVGMSSKDMHRLGVQGKVRTREEGKWTYYNRSDLEALKQPAGSSNVPPSSSKSRGDADEPPSISFQSSTPEASDTGGGGEDADVAARVGGTKVGQEFHGATIEEALSAASEALGLQKEEVAFDIVDRGSAGFLGVGRRHVRIRLRAAERLGEEQGLELSGDEGAEDPSQPKELTSVKGLVDLAPHQVLERALTFLTHLGYQYKRRTDTSVLAERLRPSPASGGKSPYLSVEVMPQTEGGVGVKVTGDDVDGFLRRQSEWAEWAEDLPKKVAQESANRPAADTAQTLHENRTSSGASELRNNTLYYSHEQAAQRLGVSAQEVETLTRSGELQAVKVGGKSLFAAKSVNGLANKRADGLTGTVSASAENEGRPAAEGAQLKAYYTPSQAAEMLGMDVLEVNGLVRRGVLPVKSIDKQRWYPAGPLEDLVKRRFGPGKLARTSEPRLLRAPMKQQTEGNPRKTTPRQPGNDAPNPKGEPAADTETRYYTVDEVSQRLGKPHHEIWGMAFSGKLRADTVGDQRLFLKRSVDDLIEGRRSVAGAGTGTTGAPKLEESSASKPNKAGGYYTVEEVAQKLGKDDVDDVWYMLYVGQLKIKMEKVRGQRVFPKHDVDSLLSTDEGAQVPQGGGVAEADEAESGTCADGSRGHGDEDSEAGGDLFYTPAQAARVLGRAFYKSNRKALPVMIVDDQRWIPAKVVDDLASTYGVHKAPDTPKPQRIRVPNYATAGEGRSNLLAELQFLKEENESLQGELELEREGRFDDVQNAQDEIDQLKSELESIRTSGGNQPEDLAAELEGERALRVESEQWVRDLQSELDKERDQRLALEESVRSSESGRYEREGYEQQLAALGSRLGEEERRRLQGEGQIRGLQARLEESEATIRTLQEAAHLDNEKVRLLEEKERLLEEVRRLLGAVEDETLPVQGPEGDPVRGKKNEAGDAASELFLKTPFGQVSFLPPFPLSKQDEEMLLLVASEDDLTAEQIRKYTGRRRAAGELEDLLDRLADEGVKDLIVEVSEDRYRFNPAALQDD